MHQGIISVGHSLEITEKDNSYCKLLIYPLVPLDEQFFKFGELLFGIRNSYYKKRFFRNALDRDGHKPKFKLIRLRFVGGIKHNLANCTVLILTN